jgi:hypothetical protein
VHVCLSGAEFSHDSLTVVCAAVAVAESAICPASHLHCPSHLHKTAHCFTRCCTMTKATDWNRIRYTNRSTWRPEDDISTPHQEPGKHSAFDATQPATSVPDGFTQRSSQTAGVFCGDVVGNMELCGETIRNWHSSCTASYNSDTGPQSFRCSYRYVFRLPGLCCCVGESSENSEQY